MTRVAVLGAGTWGTAFTVVLADAGNQVTIWGRRHDVCTAINDEHENPDYLPGVVLPSVVRASPDPSEVLDGADVVVLAVPSQSLRENLVTWAPLIPPTVLLVSLMKGVELGTSLRMSEVIGEITGAGDDRIAVVSGRTSPERSPRGNRPRQWSPAVTPAWRSACSRSATPRPSGPTR